MTAIRAVFFDVDGVLVDSLQSHLQICRDKSREFGLNLRIPDADELRNWVARGVVVSPMKRMFVAVGFPEPLAERADEDYRRDFARQYPLAPFSGVQAMLLGLARANVPLGMVTANTRAIVESALGDIATVFREDLRMTVDDPRFMTKAQALATGARSVGAPSAALIYVGDQPKDFEAAQEAGTQFLGVTYGWGIERSDTRFPTVDSVSSLKAWLLERITEPGR